MARNKFMEDQNNKEQVNKLLEDGWFFGNSLMSRSKSCKMVRCYSDPCPSATNKGMTSIFKEISKTSNLFRTPSLPPCFGKVVVEQAVDDGDVEDEPSMGELIREAMLMPVPVPTRRLNRAPSLPPCRTKEAIGVVPDVQNVGNNEVGKLKLDRKISRTNSSFDSLHEKGPIAGIKLTRRASIDSSMLLPPKYTSKATKQGGSNFKNRPQRKQMDLTITNVPSNHEPKSQTLDKRKSQKSLSDLEIKELQGFKDLGFSFDPEQVSPSVVQILPGLQRQASIDNIQSDNDKFVTRPYLSEAWKWRSSSPDSAPPVLKQVDPKLGSAEDMKIQIKFWARAVASNVRQEC